MVNKSAVTTRRAHAPRRPHTLDLTKGCILPVADLGRFKAIIRQITTIPSGNFRIQSPPNPLVACPNAKRILPSTETAYLPRIEILKIFYGEGSRTRICQLEGHHKALGLCAFAHRYFTHRAHTSRPYSSTPFQMCARTPDTHSAGQVSTLQGYWTSLLRWCFCHGAGLLLT